MLEVTKLAKFYSPTQTVFSHVSFDVKPGEVVTLLGLNGQGKTTLIKVLVSLLSPSEGLVRILGQNVHQNAATVKRRIGVVPQRTAIDRNLSVLQNLDLQGRYFGISAEVRDKKIREYAEKFSFTAYLDKKPLGLSGGTLRKIAITKALITQPQFLILDEPSAALDPMARMAVWAELKAFGQQGGGVLLSTHSFEECQAVARRVLFLHQQRLHVPDPLEGSIEDQFFALTNSRAAA